VIIFSLLTGTVVAFVYGWLTTILLLLALPIMLVSFTIQEKLIVGASNNKKAYEVSGSVSINKT